MKILLLSGYDAASHRIWREGLVRNLGEHEWTVLTLPPRFFAWRTRGNPLSLFFGRKEVITRRYDLTLATSMTDLAELKGIAPNLSVIPAIAYFHENQFEYPEQKTRKEYQNYKFTNLYTALASERVLFNSRFNRDTFLAGAEELLSAMPDHVPPGIVESVAERSSVLQVPLEDQIFNLGPIRSVGPLVMLWNHRWEHDKAPERFFKALYRLKERNVPFLIHVVGQQFRDQPGIFNEARNKLDEHILTWGFVKDHLKYRSLLATSDLVVSTALHDFQGLAVLEGAAAGCQPVVPDRLAYPEFIPDVFRYPSFPHEHDREVKVLADRLEKLCLDPEGTRNFKALDLTYLSWANMAPKYREIINTTSGI